MLLFLVLFLYYSYSTGELLDRRGLPLFLIILSLVFFLALTLQLILPPRFTDGEIMLCPSASF